MTTDHQSSPATSEARVLPRDHIRIVFHPSGIPDDHGGWQRPDPIALPPDPAAVEQFLRARLSLAPRRAPMSGMRYAPASLRFDVGRPEPVRRVVNRAAEPSMSANATVVDEPEGHDLPEPPERRHFSRPRIRAAITERLSGGVRTEPDEYAMGAPTSRGPGAASPRPRHLEASRQRGMGGILERFANLGIEDETEDDEEQYIGAYRRPQRRRPLPVDPEFGDDNEDAEDIEPPAPRPRWRFGADWDDLDNEPDR